MANPLSHIYKMHQIYENNWTQLYNKTILYKKVQDCIQINTNKSKKTPFKKCLAHRRSVSFKFTGIQNSIKLSRVSHHFMGNTHWFREYFHTSPVSTILCRPVNTAVDRLSWWWERH